MIDVLCTDAAIGRAIARLSAALERHAKDRSAPLPPASSELPQTLAGLRDGFGLSPFECELLLLCAGIELDSEFAAACAAAHGDARRSYPTFALALRVLPGGHASALLPSAPLRRYALIEVEREGPLLHSPLRLPERVLHHLLGTVYLDEHLTLLEELSPAQALLPGEASPALPASLIPLRDRLVALWQHTYLEADSGSQALVLNLCGAPREEARIVATAVCRELGWRLFCCRVADVPPGPSEREALCRLWTRDLVLAPSALLLDCSDDSRETLAAAHALVARLPGPLLICSPAPLPGLSRPCLRLRVPELDAASQRALWQAELGADAVKHSRELDRISEFFKLDMGVIKEVCAMLKSEPQADALLFGERLWEACRSAVQKPLTGLAQRITPAATWADLVLPPAQSARLREIAAQARHRTQVLDTWGFGGSGRGQGVTALFAGPSGTGKTLAAEVLANELRLDLFHIDLSQVVSKYIGETEKNLAQLFSTAEASGAILLFDEADALFGRRSEVKDSHDRYANIEVSYLLQRMERFRGLAILTTNHLDALDNAFLRRLGFVVEFPFPDSEQRRAIWGRIFPPRTPTAELDLGKLARVPLTGGNIHSVALRAAYLAADAEQPVSMSHLAKAVRSEHGKNERPFDLTKIGDWG